jgi:hypothetical protein
MPTTVALPHLRVETRPYGVSPSVANLSALTFQKREKKKKKKKNHFLFERNGRERPPLCSIHVTHCPTRPDCLLATEMESVYHPNWSSQTDFRLISLSFPLSNSNQY